MAYRRAWSHPVFASLLEAAIWNWLYQTAAWKKTQVRFNGKVFDLERGQLATSISFMAKGFGITDKRANGVIKKLQKHGMLVKLGGEHGSIITICNYDVFQPSETTQGKQGGEHRSNTGQTQVNNKKEEKEDKERKEGSKEDTSLSQREQKKPADKPPAVSQKPHPAFDQFWITYPRQRRHGRTEAIKAYNKLVAAGHDPDAILQGVMRYAASDEVARGFAKNPTGWLREERFLLNYKPAPKGGYDEHGSPNRPTIQDAITAGVRSAV